MPLFSKKEVINLKLNSIPLKELKELALKLGIIKHNSSTEIIKDILDKQVEEKFIDEFIKQKYKIKVEERKKIISDEDLKNELKKVKTFSWGIVQGQLDQKIQTEYVRKIVRYDILINHIKSNLHNEITSLCNLYMVQPLDHCAYRRTYKLSSKGYSNNKKY